MSVLPTNATLTRIDVPGAANGAGEVSFSTGSAISVECLLDAVSEANKWALGAQIAEADAVIFVEAALLASASIQEGSRLVVTLGSETLTYEVIKRQVFVFDEVSHVQCFVKKV